MQTQKTGKQHAPLFILLAVLIPLVLPAAAQAAIHVDLAVDETTSPASLKVTGNNAQCADGPVDCIDVSKGSSPNLYFDLDRACSSFGPNYRLSQFRIAMTEKGWPTAENPLPDYVAADFNADATTGVVDLGAGSNQLRDYRIKLKDENSKAYDVFYEITATACDGSGTIVLDPTVRNTGK